MSLELIYLNEIREVFLLTKVGPGQELLTEEERDKIIARAHSVFSWVGNLIPDREKFDGTMIELRNVVFRLRTKNGITNQDRQLAHILIGKIKERKRELEKHLEHDVLTRDVALNLLDEISGLIRAINDLHDVELNEVFEARKTEIMNRIDDEKRWLEYLKQLKIGTA